MSLEAVLTDPIELPQTTVVHFVGSWFVLHRSQRERGPVFILSHTASAGDKNTSGQHSPGGAEKSGSSAFISHSGVSSSRTGDRA